MDRSLLLTAHSGLSSASGAASEVRGRPAAKYPFRFLARAILSSAVFMPVMIVGCGGGGSDLDFDASSDNESRFQRASPQNQCVEAVSTASGMRLKNNCNQPVNVGYCFADTGIGTCNGFVVPADEQGRNHVKQIITVAAGTTSVTLGESQGRRIHWVVCRWGQVPIISGFDSDSSTGSCLFTR